MKETVDITIRIDYNKGKSERVIRSRGVPVETACIALTDMYRRTRRWLKRKGSVDDNV